MTRQIMEYGLSVGRDDVERRYRRLPEVVHCPGFAPWQGIANGRNGYIKAHHVIVLKLGNGRVVEQTTILSIKMNRGSHFMCPKPHGVGWKLHDAENDKYTVYRRPAPDLGQITFVDDAKGKGL